MPAPLNDRLGELLDENQVLYGMICRDATRTDIELLAQAGYHIAWIDLEHSHQSSGQALELCRTASHLGMVPLVRMIELSRTHVQRLLDGGADIVALPDVRSAAEARHLARLGKFPPLGERGVASSVTGTGYTLMPDPQERLRQANEATHLMAMIETDTAYQQLDELLAIDAIDLLSVGPMDWGVSLGLFGDEARTHLAPKIEHVLKAGTAAGKIIGWGVGDPQQAAHYRDLGMRLFFLGPDVGIKYRVFNETIDLYRTQLD